MRIEAKQRLVATENEKLKASKISFQYIKDKIGSSLRLHEWDVDNGGKVKAQVKTTIRSGEVKTAYLHITIIKPNGYWEYYREYPGDKFKRMSYGKS